MNIFWLDDDPERNARFHCDDHVEMCCIDYSRILCTAADMRGFFDPSRMYEPIPEVGTELHEWAASTWDNYVKLLKLTKALGKEHEHRYGVEHECINRVVSKIDIHDINIRDEGATEPPLKVPDGYTRDRLVQSYRNYYMHGYNRKMSWFNRGRPDWYHGKEVVYDGTC